MYFEFRSSTARLRDSRSENRYDPVSGPSKLNSGPNTTVCRTPDVHGTPISLDIIDFPLSGKQFSYRELESPSNAERKNVSPW